jgi:hypothetical protein
MESGLLVTVPPALTTFQDPAVPLTHLLEPCHGHLDAHAHTKGEEATCEGELRVVQDRAGAPRCPPQGAGGVVVTQKLGAKWLTCSRVGRQERAKHSTATCFPAGTSSN